MASYLDLEMERRSTTIIHILFLKNINFFLSFVFIEQGAKDAHVLGYAYETYPLSNYDFIRRYCFVC